MERSAWCLPPELAGALWCCPIMQRPSAGCMVSEIRSDEMILVARGEQGRVWRLDTDHGAFAIKELIIRQTPADACRCRLSRGRTRDRCGADAATHPDAR